MQESTLFARAYYGELVGLALGILAIIRMGMTTVEFVGVMLSIFVVHAFLIWAWSRRYPFMNWLYALWSIPTFLMLLALFIGIALALAGGPNAGASSRGLQFGDGSMSIFGLAAILVALVSRGAGLLWCLTARRDIEFRESSRIPAILMALVLFFSTAYLFTNTPLLEKLVLAGGMGFYGLGISI